LRVPGATCALIACAPHLTPEVPDRLGENATLTGEEEALSGKENRYHNPGQ